MGCRVLRAEDMAGAEVQRVQGRVDLSVSPREREVPGGRLLGDSMYAASVSTAEF